MPILHRAALVIPAAALTVLAAGADQGASKGPPTTRPGTATSPVAEVIAPTPPASQPTNPRELLRVTWDAVLGVLQNDKLDQKAKEAEIERIVIPIVDLPLMAKLSLGGKHWNAMTPSQRERFTRRFVERLKSTYRKRIAAYTGQRVVLKEAPKAAVAGTAKAPPPRTARIAVELVCKETRIDILHKLRRKGSRWKMYDTEIEGVSLLLTYRSQFDDILRHGSIEDLLARLAEPTPAR